MFQLILHHLGFHPFASRRGSLSAHRRSELTSRRPRGLTLLELMLVLIIIVLVGAIAWPRIAHRAAEAQLREAALALKNDLAVARAGAIEFGEPWACVIFPATGEYRVGPWTVLRAELAGIGPQSSTLAPGTASGSAMSADPRQLGSTTVPGAAEPFDGNAGAYGANGTAPSTASGTTASAADPAAAGAQGAPLISPLVRPAVEVHQLPGDCRFAEAQTAPTVGVGAAAGAFDGVSTAQGTSSLGSGASPAAGGLNPANRRNEWGGSAESLNSSPGLGEPSAVAGLGSTLLGAGPPQAVVFETSGRGPTAEITLADPGNGNRIQVKIRGLTGGVTLGPLERPRPTTPDGVEPAVNSDLPMDPLSEPYTENAAAAPTSRGGAPW